MQLSNSRTKKMRHVFVGGVFFLGVLFLWTSIPLARQMEQATLDYRYAHFNRETQASDRVVFLDIDEQSMKLMAPTYGRWPWPRRIYRELIEFLSIGQPAGIFFDILFTEPQLGTEDDSQLAEVSSLSYTSHAMNLLMDPAEERNQQSDPLDLPADFDSRYGVHWRGDVSGLWKPVRPFRDYLLPASEYMKKVKHLHAVTFERDSDGVYRRVRWAYPYGKVWIPSLALGGLLSFLNHPVLEKTDEGFQAKGEGGQNLEVPTSEDGSSLLHFYRPEKGPQAIPFGALLASAAQLQKGEVADPAQLKVNPLLFKDKVVIVGGSAAGLEDLKGTPVHSSYPGGLLHATAISNILKNDTLKRANPALRLVLGILMVLATYISVMFIENLWLKVGVPCILGCLYFSVTAFVFYRYSLWLDLAIPECLGILAMVDGLAYTSFVELAEKRKMKSTLSKYLSPAVTEQIVASGKDPSAEVGHAKELSILFSDIRGFTTLSESVDPHVLVARLNDYLEKMTDEIFLYKGTLDKFIGDAVMAFWGAPLNDTHHAENAVACALGMIKALELLNKNWADQGKNEMPLSIGIGINTGKVIVGNIGSDKRIDYTVIGDNVNLASRIEGLTKQYHSQFLVGEATYAAIQQKFICRVMDSVQVKGKNKSVRIYEPLCFRSDPQAALLSELAERFEKGFLKYEVGEFSKAYECFNSTSQWARSELKKAQGDGPCEVYMERCQELIREAPLNWNGIFIAKSK